MSTSNHSQAQPFVMHPADGWVMGARRSRSPNHDDRPDATHIDTIVLHNISLPPGVFGGREVEQFFLNRLDCDAHPYFDALRDVRVSAHFLLRRNGELIQFVPVTQRAWHAGESFFYGRSRLNDTSIGIEIEGTDDESFDPRQYPVLADLVSALMQACPQVGVERICGHSDIAPGRKTDPGGFFDWARFRQLLCARL